jgi:hypothetical protein
MNHRFTSTFAYVGSVALATLAAALMSGQARAEGPIEVLPPFIGSLTRAEVRADLMKHRARATSFASEWSSQQNQAVSAMSGYTREQARSDFIAAREQVRAMTAEAGDPGTDLLPRRNRGVSAMKSGFSSAQ